MNNSDKTVIQYDNFSNRPKTFITNISSEHIEIYKEAIYKTSAPLIILSIAFDDYGNTLENSHSLHLLPGKENYDLNYFWKIYNNLYDNTDDK